MTNAAHNRPLDRLTQAYEKMLEELNLAMKRTRESAIPGFKEYLQDVRDKMVELGELTREEADEIARYVERDVKDAATYLAETGEQFAQWWRFDVQQVEERMLDMFINVADKTKLELLKFKEMSREASIYHTGEVTGPGTLVCSACGKPMHFHKAGHIPPCPGCHGTRFARAGKES